LWIETNCGSLFVDHKLFFLCLDMEEDVGRGRHGRDSRAHGSARRQVPPPPKRGRKKVQPAAVEGCHDAEAGGSRSRTRRAQVDAPDEAFDAGQFLDDNANWEEAEPQLEQQLEQQPHEPQHALPAQDDDEYGGGPKDLSLLSLYHKHRAIPIWHAQSEDDVYT
jgi:hypothetical protein